MKTKKIVAFIMALALTSSSMIGMVSSAEEIDGFYVPELISITDEEEIDQSNIDVEYIDAAALIDSEDNSAVSGFTANQTAAYNDITSACNEFMDSSVDLSTNAFKVVTLSSGVTVTEIGSVVSEIKASNKYPVLDKIGLYSTSDNSSYDKVALFTKSEYRKASARKELKVSEKVKITSAVAGNEKVTLTWDAVEGATNYCVYKYLNNKFTAVAVPTGTSYTVTGLTNGTNYGFLVRACVNGVYTSYDTTDIAYATPAAVDKPVIKTAAPGDGSVTLTWDAVPGATNYCVYKYLNNKFTAVAAPTGTSYTVTGLTNGTNYGFLVRACVNGVFSSYNASDIEYATPAALIKPVIKTATPGNSSVALTWDAVEGATKYCVYTYIDGKYKAIATPTGTSYTVTGLTNGTKYGFLVRACVNGVYTSYDTSDIEYATPTAESKPVIRTATPGDGSVTLTWDDVEGATKYCVYTYYNGKYKAIATPTGTSYTVTGLTNGTNYGFLVRACVNGVYTSYETSDIKYAVPQAPAKPVIKTATSGNGSVTLTWGAVEGATNYRVYTYLNGKYTAVATPTGTSYTVTGLTNGTKYGFLVRACVNGVYTSYTASDVKFATPIAAEVKPVIKTATPGNGSVTVTWGAVEGATKYCVYTYLDGKYKAIATPTGTSYTVTGLTNGTKYGFLVRACVNGVYTSYETSDIKYATPAAEAKPVINTVTSGSGSATISWSAVEGATNYCVYTYLNGKYTAIAVPTGTSYTVTGLTSGTNYGFLVRACVNGVYTSYNTSDVKYATIK